MVSHQSTNRSLDQTTLLRRSLQLDGAASGLCGALLLLAARPIATLIGFRTPTIAWAVGASLVVYAAALLWNASRVNVDREQVVIAVVLNAAWVAGSVAVIVIGSLTPIGNVAVAVVGAAVLGFTTLEIAGLRRWRPA
ncbi:MAG: hypothetical protein AUH30_02755 [Candidatus Rokubacteria bacterium 13_1_40CM_68_15]|nr:MAG: hypothetical protein AUH30_02755 [Candidatus Rokubacteria bacterium 13_1_40CM_68_15]